MAISIIGILIALLLPAVQAAREVARRIQCMSNLKQIGIGFHNYHDANGTLPPGSKATYFGTWQVFVLPFVEQQALFNAYNQWGDDIQNNSPNAVDLTFAGPPQSTVVSARLAIFTCPSDAPFAGPWGYLGWDLTRHNYLCNFGNTDYSNQDPFQGVSFGGAPFADILTTPYTGSVPKPGTPTVSFAAITDGLSVTMLASEGLQAQSVAGVNLDIRGATWFGQAAGFNAFLGPNSPTPDEIPVTGCVYPYGRNPPCVEDVNGTGEYLAARSAHGGGVGVLMGDGGVKFVKDTINLSVWRGLSTRSGGEVVDAGAY